MRRRLGKIAQGFQEARESVLEAANAPPGAQIGHCQDAFRTAWRTLIALQDILTENSKDEVRKNDGKTLRRDFRQIL